MYQPAVGAFGAAGVTATTAPIGLKRPAFNLAQRFRNFDVADLDLIVDLGDEIGSRRWWRGLATLLFISIATIQIGTRPVALPGGAPPALTEEQLPLLSPATIAPLALGGTTGEQVAATKRVVRLAEPPERPRIEVVARLGRSDSVQAALRRAGVSAPEVTTIVDLLDDATNLRSVKPGTGFDLVLGRRPNKTVPRPLESLAFRAAFELKLEVNRAADGQLALKRIPIAVDNTPLRVSGRVGGSLYKSARAAGVPAGIVSEYIKLLSYGLDFQRDVKGANNFDIVVEHRRAETGETETGRLIYAGLDQGKRKIELMRWDPSNDREQFFHADGSSARKGLMKTPIDGARMSSGFGMRLHPILGYSRLHKGVDFAAGTGTPIMAAASGTVVYAGVYRGYGNHVRIRHANGIETTYSHMSRFGKGGRVGARIEQGQVIGYVGSTGMSTGPHLHYEVYLKGRAVDPRSAKLPFGVQLAGSDMSRFKARMGEVRNLRVKAPAAEQVAATDKKTEKKG
ncbi:M23 family metallopeptidase [Sphingoaurantiacus capsulatus]|uniref:M23 family metallopeptidase n=1 Tax=Sphingoaurantiacus capsulatus TaxID=1771310 RepID=A0ABV7X8E3_9SPHN